MIELINGNSYELINEVIERAVNPIIVTDPPFNIGYHYNTYKDKMKNEEYIERLSSILSLCPFVLIHYAEDIFKIGMKLGKCPEKLVSWVYNSNTPKQHREIGFFGVKPDFKKVTQPYKNLNDKRIKERIAKGIGGGKLYDWWNINQVKNTNKEKTAHPCQMPQQVMDNILGILPNDATIIDPYMGSGTTGISAKKLGLNFVGIEIDKDYFELSKKRIYEL